MDLSVFERVFALRDEVREADLDADAPDLSSLSGEKGQGEEVVRPPSLPREKLAADFMKRAAELHEQANPGRDKQDLSTGAAVAELLEAASAPLPIFDPSDLVTGRVAPVPEAASSVASGAVETPVAEPSPPTGKKDAPKGKRADHSATKDK